MNPDLAQDFHLSQHPQTGGGVGCPDRGEKLLPVPAELLGAFTHRCLAARDFPDLDFPAVPLGHPGSISGTSQSGSVSAISSRAARTLSPASSSRLNRRTAART
ncbi:hypothetical protein [Streptomyces sp. NPDC005485]|uniref:hypothetical protein n=1 Tax=Streptomyces sp. NPDC005485 TaxID=3155591 RepID=UPI00339F709D